MVRNITDVLSSVVRRGRSEEQVTVTRDTCFVCGSDLVEADEYLQFRVCPICGFHYSMTARERIASLADPSTFRETNRSVISLDPLSFSSRVSYTQRLFRDQRRTGLTEAIVTGTCTIGGSPVMLVVLDFGFMGGTMGCVVGEKVALAFERAVKRKLPVVALVTSGGARVQEGILSLMQMGKTTVAANRLNNAGLPYISVLANPATGQAFASFANLADVVLAEPGSIVGFSPLQVIQESSDQPLPKGSHTAEAHFDHGMLDAVVERSKLKDLLAVLLDLLGPQYRLMPRQKRQKIQVDAQRPVAWNSVQLARHESRPTSADYLSQIFTSFVELHGDRAYGDDPAVICGLGRLGGQTVMVIGQERGRGAKTEARNDGRMSPEGFRKAQRVISLASKFDMPLITLIDTPGPNLGVEVEERGLGHTIATTMAALGNLNTPSISVVIGEGGSGGALALGVTDRVLMMENAIYSAISPEDAAELIFQDEAKADEVAESLRLTAWDCLELEIIDAIVPEPQGGAHTNPDDAARQLRRSLIQEIAELQSISKRRLAKERYKKFRNMGEYSSRFRAGITREVNALQGLIGGGVRRITRRRSANVDELPDDFLSSSEPANVDPPPTNGT